MAEVVEAYRSVTASEEFKELERLRDRAGHNEAAALHNAENKKAMEIAKNLKSIGTDIDVIAQATGLPVEKILGL